MTRIYILSFVLLEMQNKAIQKVNGLRIMEVNYISIRSQSTNLSSELINQMHVCLLCKTSAKGL